jgi:hypothetical protein
MKIINHGKWSSYKPKPHPSGAPLGAAFARRDEDNVDWYDYIHRGDYFKKDSVKIAATFMDVFNKWVVMIAVREPDRIFPADQILLEITDFDGEDPQEFFGRKSYDPDTETFSDNKEF